MYRLGKRVSNPSHAVTTEVQQEHCSCMTSRDEILSITYRRGWMRSSRMVTQTWCSSWLVTRAILKSSDRCLLKRVLDSLKRMDLSSWKPQRRQLQMLRKHSSRLPNKYTTTSGTECMTCQMRNQASEWAMTHLKQSLVKEPRGVQEPKYRKPLRQGSRKVVDAVDNHCLIWLVSYWKLEISYVTILHTFLAVEFSDFISLFVSCTYFHHFEWS